MNLHQILTEYRKGKLTEEETIILLRGTTKLPEPKEMTAKELLTLILNVTSVLLDKQLPTDTASYQGRSQSELVSLLCKAGKCVPGANRNGLVDNFLNQINNVPEEVMLDLNFEKDGVSGDEV